jgi:hypothetical protein
MPAAMVSATVPRMRMAVTTVLTIVGLPPRSPVRASATSSAGLLPSCVGAERGRPLGRTHHAIAWALGNGEGRRNHAIGGSARRWSGVIVGR